MKLLAFVAVLFSSHLCLATDFSPFQRLLDRHLKVTDLAGGGFQTAFDYTEAQKHAKTSEDLSQQSKILKKFDPSSLQSKNDALAFWINSYNFFMIKIILERGFDEGQLDIDGVKDFGSFFNPYWIFKQEFNEIGGEKYSLDQIEKGTLLGEAYKKKGWKDARIHFAVNCASVGCPPLIKTVYKSATLDKTLDENIKKAFKTKRHLHIKEKTLHLTHLFKWYKQDFVDDAGSVKKFILQYIKNENRQKQIQETKEIEHIDYNWELNKPENF